MILIGLTGGIGSGKSTVSDFLIKKGFKVSDADRISKDIMKPNSNVIKRLQECFGRDIVDENGNLRRKYLAEIVFGNAEKEKILNDITHKEIKSIISAEIESYREKKEKISFIDVPLLFEVGLDKKCDYVWTVVADFETKINRVMQRDDISKEDVISRMKSQMPDEEKIKKSDEVIYNIYSKEELYNNIEKLLEKYEDKIK